MNNVVRSLHAAREPFWGEVRFWYTERSSIDGVVETRVAQAVNMVKVDVGGFTSAVPTIQLHDEQAQEFMDQLWRLGFRPREGTGSAGSLAATERHLEDMRKLVFRGEAKERP